MEVKGLESRRDTPNPVRAVPGLLLRSVLHDNTSKNMVLGTAILVGMLAGLTILSVSGFAVQMYLILSGKIPQSRQYMYPSHHTFVPFYHV